MMLIGNKCDLDNKGLNATKLSQKSNTEIPVVIISALEGTNLEKLRREIFKALDIHLILADFVGTPYFFVGEEFSLSFKAHQLKSFSHAFLSNLFCIETDRMETLQRFRKFLDQGRLAHTGKPCDQKILLS